MQFNDGVAERDSFHQLLQRWLSYGSLIASLIFFSTPFVYAQPNQFPTTQETDSINEADRLNQQVLKLFHERRYSEAMPLAQKVLALRERALGPEDPHTTIAVHNLAKIYYEMGAYNKAESLFQRALALYEKDLDPEHWLTADGLDDLAKLYRATGAYAKAEPLFQRSLAIREKVFGPEHADTATSLNNLAVLYHDIGVYAQAKPLSQRALAIRKKVLGPDHTDTAQSLNNLAELYYDMGAYTQAEPLYQRALVLYERDTDPDNALAATVLSNLAKLYWATGTYAKAEPLNQRALAIREKALGPQHPDTAKSLNNLAALYVYMGAYAKAEPLNRRALAIREKVLGPQHPDTANSLYSLANLYQATGAFNKAEPLYRKALAIAMDGRHPQLLWIVHYGLAHLRHRQGRAAEAIFFAKQAVNSLQNLRSGLKNLDDELQQSFVKSKESTYQTLAGWLIDEGRIPEAQEVLAMLKEKEYFDFIRGNADSDPRRTRASYTGKEPELAKRWNDIALRLAELGKEQRELEQRIGVAAKLGHEPDPKDEEHLIKVNADLKLANDHYKEVLGQIEATLIKEERQSEDAAARRKLFDKSNMQLSEDRQGMLRELRDEGQPAALLEYVITEDKTYIIVTTPEVTFARPVVVKAKELNHKIAELSAALHDPTGDPRPASQALYALLVAPVAEHLKHSGAKTLMLSLDGALRYIPFATLHDGEHYLVERYALSLYTLAGQRKITERPDKQWHLSGFGLTQKVEGFDQLRGVKSELDSINNRIPGKVYLDKQFNETQFKRSLLTKPKVVHIASHFVFRPGTKDNSFLLLGDGQHLSLDALGSFKFDGVDLLALSACQTGVGGGKDANGQEVESFGVLAQKQQAKGVLASLWPVADTSTAKLMQRFYQLKQEQHLTKAEALRQAQLELMRARGDNPTATRSAVFDKPAARSQAGNPAADYSHPYYWAPFILMGNWL